MHAAVPLTAIALGQLWYFAEGATYYAMQHMVVADPMGHLLGLFATLAMMTTLIYARPYAAARDMLKGELFTLSMFSLLGILVMVAANNFLVTSTDAAGNAGLAGASLALTIDGTAPLAPAAPTLVPADDTGAAGDGITSARRPRFKGSAEAGSTVQIRDANGVVIAAAVAGWWLLAGLAVAAVVAWCNATSTAALAVHLPVSGVHPGLV